MNEIEEKDKKKINYWYFIRVYSYDEIRILLKDKYTYSQIRTYLSDKIRNYKGIQKWWV